MSHQRFLKNAMFIILIFILAGAIGFFVLTLDGRGDFGVIGKWECKKIGGKMEQCFLSSPCCVKDFSDGGKQCSSGKECEAGICVISAYDSPQEVSHGIYIGKCPGNFTGEKLRCGQAAIEGGRIVKDLRTQKCLIY
jgi:hypothetical protein